MEPMTRRLVRGALAFAICLTLAACERTPRGAGFQAEVLDAAIITEEQLAAGQVPEFAVFPVTRSTQTQLASWPSLDAARMNWIRHQEQPNSSLIAPGDTLSVTVWDADENSLLAGPGQRVAQLPDIQVSSGGVIFLPFLGEMRVAGMSASTARQRIEERYTQTIPSVQVQLSVTQGRANTADLVAGVSSPGTYPLPDRNVSILSLLSLGGGVSPGLSNPQVRLFRGSNVYGISLDRLYDDPGLDTTIQGGDRVIVEEEERYFLSLGAAGTEALHYFPQDRVTALDALAIIGGVADARADPEGILVLREYRSSMVRTDGSGPPQTRVVFTIDLTSADGLFSARNFTIMPGDLVYATESPVTAARTILGLIGTSFGLANQIGN